MLKPQTKPSVNFPEKLQPLFKPARYKILYGGRGGCKSWGVARALLILGAQHKLRILCARELQKSIKDSVHQLLSDQVANLGFKNLYSVQHAMIKGKNGTRFFFEGLRHNAYQIKSYEGIDLVWVEEAVTVSKGSWDVLIPTIRKENSEIWLTFNPELEEDETYQRFVLNPPQNSFVQKLNWSDNPWFPEVLRLEKDALKERNEEDYLNVWEGHCKQSVEGAIYRDEMNEAHQEGRITSVPHDATQPVCTFWDLGYGDQTAIWFIQQVGFEYHVIDFYQNARKKLQHYLDIIQKKKYIYATDYLPHDGSNNYLVGKSVQDTMASLKRTVSRVPRVGAKVDALSAVRTVFPMCYFDKDKCADGLQSLRRYRYAADADSGKVSKEPLHDMYSNGADAFATFATAPHIAWESFVEQAGYGDRGKMKSDWDPYDEARG